LINFFEGFVPSTINSQPSTIFHMAKTEVILTHNIIGLGGESDQVRVAAGYARNYLVPARFCGSAHRREQTPHRSAQTAARRARGARVQHHDRTRQGRFAKLICVVKVKAGDDGKMFGSVTAGVIADELKHQFDITLDKRKIHLEQPIKALGEHEVQLHLHAEVKRHA
jgi:large subunit ribosomal protein L9